MTKNEIVVKTNFRTAESVREALEFALAEDAETGSEAVWASEPSAADVRAFLDDLTLSAPAPARSLTDTAFW